MTSVTMVSTPNDGSCGIGTYTGNLLTELDDELEVDHVTVPLRSKNPLPYIVGAVEAGFASEDVVHVQHEYGIFGPKSIWSWLFFPILYLTTYYSDTPVVVTLHSAWNRETIGPPFVFLKRIYVKLNNSLIIRGVNYSVFLSDNCYERFAESVPVARYEVIPHGVQVDTAEISSDEAKHEFGYRANETVVAVPGYIRPEKGQDVFVEIADQVSEHNFLIAGGTQADEDESFRREIEHSAPENIQITGVLDQDEFHTAFVASDLIVLPYRDVTQSGIFNWCVAYEVPTVASDEPYFARLKAEWNCVELFDLEHPTEAAELIQMLLKDEHRREELVVGMRDYGKASSTDAVVNKHNRIYDAIQ